MDPGARLKEVRSKLGITTREFSAFSKIIADAEGNEEFLISSGWLTQIENEEDALPSIYKLFTLASVYGLSYGDILALYGVDAKKVKKYHAELPIAKTRLAQYDSAEAPESLEVPVRFDAGVNLSQTNLLSHMIESWGRVPLEFIQHFDLRHRLYGFIGLKDYTLYPLIRPGSFVEIDPNVKKPIQGMARSEFDRPIYFVDLRNEYACSWCGQDTYLCIRERSGDYRPSDRSGDADCAFSNSTGRGDFKTAIAILALHVNDATSS